MPNMIDGARGRTLPKKKPTDNPFKPTKPKPGKSKSKSFPTSSTGSKKTTWNKPSSKNSWTKPGSKNTWKKPSSKTNTWKAGVPKSRTNKTIFNPPKAKVPVGTGTASYGGNTGASKPRFTGGGNSGAGTGGGTVTRTPVGPRTPVAVRPPVTPPATRTTRPNPTTAVPGMTTIKGGPTAASRFGNIRGRGPRSGQSLTPAQLRELAARKLRQR